jgi:hypothetical protein
MGFEMDRPTDAEIEAAANVLDSVGRQYKWWPATAPSYKTLDPIGRNEFEAIVEQMLMAAARARKS